MADPRTIAVKVHTVLLGVGVARKFDLVAYRARFQTRLPVRYAISLYIYTSMVYILTGKRVCIDTHCLVRYIWGLVTLTEGAVDDFAEKGDI
jgi:hypothetical protein